MGDKYGVAKGYKEKEPFPLLLGFKFSHQPHSNPSYQTYHYYSITTSTKTYLILLPFYHTAHTNNNHYPPKKKKQQPANMGAVVSCFQAIGDCIMTVISAIAGVIMSIINGCVAVLAAIVRFLTCTFCPPSPSTPTIDPTPFLFPPN